MSLFDAIFGKTTAADYMPPTYKCSACGNTLYVGQMHFCGVYPRSEGAKAVAPLTEADVRRIIREELQAWWTGKKPTDNSADTSNGSEQR